ncbi:MAG TPA: aminopeptidase [Candidatus Latescibacteria bacterium]|nr:aminopeptidase [Candidatus Latescibacterota bacterium]
MNQLHRAAEIAVRKCLAVQSYETVLIITDEGKRKIGYAFWEAAKSLGSEVILVEIIPRKRHGEEPPPVIADMMKKVDVIFAPTSKSLTHTDARREASLAGARTATLPGITEDSMVRTLTADYDRIAKRTNKIASVLTEGSIARVTTPRGTDITMSISGRQGLSDTGLFHRKGAYGNLPAGEAFLAPVEGSAKGVIVIDGAIADTGMVRHPITLTVKNGLVTEITGKDEAQMLRSLLEPIGKLAYNIAELGIGTNDKAILTGNVLEDEKAIGTVHIALGNNVSMGGSINVPIHLDGILLEPTLTIDDKAVLQNGTLLID